VRLLTLCLFVEFIMSSIVLASPLTDYSQGNVAIDYTYRFSINAGGQIPSFADFKGPGYTGFNGKLATEGEITAGLGNNFAVQYRQFNPTFNGPAMTNGAYYDKYSGSIQSQEFNILYKLDRHFSLFTGLIKVKPYMSENSFYPGWSASSTICYAGPEERMGQFGLVVSTEIADKLKAYGIGALGAEYRSWQIGLSYALSKSWDLNVDYRNTTFNNYTVSLGNSGGDPSGVQNLTAKGLGIGVTYKF